MGSDNKGQVALFSAIVFCVGVWIGCFIESSIYTQASPPPDAQSASAMARCTVLNPVLPSAVPFTTSYQRLTSDDLAAATLLPNIPDGSRFAWVQVEDQDVRWRNDNTLPTANLGMLIYAGSVFKYDLSDGPIRVIRTQAGAVANIWYERGDSF